MPSQSFCGKWEPWVKPPGHKAGVPVLPPPPCSVLTARASFYVLSSYLPYLRLTPYAPFHSPSESSQKPLIIEIDDQHGPTLTAQGALLSHLGRGSEQGWICVHV